MKNSIKNITLISKNVINKICNIGLDICKSRIDTAIVLGKNCSSATNMYKKASQQIKDEEYELGFDNIIKSFNICERIINRQNLNGAVNKNTSKNYNHFLNVSIILLIVGIILLLIVGLKQKR